MSIGKIFLLGFLVFLCMAAGWFFNSMNQWQKEKESVYLGSIECELTPFQTKEVSGWTKYICTKSELGESSSVEITFNETKNLTAIHYKYPDGKQFRFIYEITQLTPYVQIEQKAVSVSSIAEEYPPTLKKLAIIAIPLRYYIKDNLEPLNKGNTANNLTIKNIAHILLSEGREKSSYWGDKLVLKPSHPSNDSSF